MSSGDPRDMSGREVTDRSIPRPKKVVWQPTRPAKRQLYWLWWERPALRTTVTAEVRDRSRIEVTSTDGDARLVSEGTTRFFVESGRGSAAASTARKPALQGSDTTIR